MVWTVCRAREARHLASVGAVLALWLGGLRGDAAAAPRPPLDPSELAIVLYGRPVLMRDPPARWERGAPRLEAFPDPDSGDETIRVVRDAAAPSLPPAWASWVGRTVRLFNDAGPLCEATVEGLEIVGWLAPGVKARERWEAVGDGRFEDDARARIAREVWPQSRRFLVAKLAAGACHGATWARAADRPAPTVAAPTPLRGPRRDQALDAFRALPAWAAVQRRYQRIRPGRSEWPDGPWDRAAHEDDVDAVAFELPAAGGGTRTLISVTAEIGGPCFGFEGRAWALWERAADGTLTLRSRRDAQPPRGFHVRAAIDLGVPEGVVLLYGLPALGGGVMRAGSGGGFAPETGTAIAVTVPPACP